MNPSRRFRNAVEIVLAALLALPAFLIAGAHAAAAQAAPPAAAFTQPGDAPTLCVNDVVRQFNSLKHHPEALGFHLGAGAADPTSGRHYQGIVRIPGEGPPRFLTTRNGNPGPFEPLSYAGPGEVNVVELASRPTDGQRVRSNRLVANQSVQDTQPPAEDKVIKSVLFEGDFATGYAGYMHLGGLQMWGDVAIIGMDRPWRNPATEPYGSIVMLNVADPMNPTVIAKFPMDHNASSIGVAPFGEDRLLIVTTGNNGSPVYGFETYRYGKPTRDLRSDYSNPLGLRPVFEFDAANANIGWPTGFQSLQTTNLFTDCNTGEIFLMGGYNLNPFENTSRDRLGMWKLDPLADPPMGQPVSKRQIWCEFDHTDRACNMGAASGFYVSPSGDLIMYGATHDNDGPGATVEMAEFSSQDGYDQDGAYRPTAVPGTYKGQPKSPIRVDGTASRPAVAQARVELYDEPNFGGRGLVIDYPDHGREDYRHLSRVDDYNDEASSVRWRVPTGCEAVLYDDKDYAGPKRTLDAGGGVARNLSNLQSFNDDTTSVQFYGPCDGRIVSWSWDLDNDGSEDATGPTPTITAATGGVHALALTVCSGFGVCDKQVGTLDASAGTLPKTTATVTGTAGTNGWYRSAVTLNLSATGEPAPTEIRYSATGAGARGEVVVPGTSATVTVQAQGETTVAFRAVNASGEEASQTVTVKVDTVAPALTVRAPLDASRYVSGSAVAVAVDCTDATSGMATCSPNGSALDTAGAGARTLTATATDAAGNSTTKAVNYTLVTAPAVDGQLVFVARTDASPGPIQRSNTDGSNVVQLTDLGDDPVWSPDGTKVAYVLSSNGVRQVRVMNADGTGNKAITANTTWQASSPSWSPDGSRIVYSGAWVEAPNATDRIIHRALLTVPAAGGASTVVVASDTADLADPVFARNGATITFVGGNQIRSVPVAGVPAGELGTVLVGGNQWYERLSYPNWSPDGTTLTFQLSHAETSTSDIWAWAGAGNPVNLTGTDTAWPPAEIPTAPLEIGPTFLPDGRMIYEQGGNVYLMAAQRGAERVLLLDLPYGIRSVDARGA